MPHINRIFQSLEKLAAYEDRIAACMEHSDLIKAAGRISFLTKVWRGFRNLFRRKAAPKKAPTAPTAEQATKAAPTAEQATQTTKAAPTAEQTTKAAPTAEQATQTTKTAPTAEQATQTTKTAPTAEQAAGATETAEATAADPGLIARHPYLAMAGSAGTAGLATYWLTPEQHYTPPPADDYAFLDDMYRERMNRA